MMLPSTKSKLINGFAQVSALLLMAGAFLLVIGSPYSVEIREAGPWMGKALLVGLVVYAAYQLIIQSKSIYAWVKPLIYHLAKLPGELIHGLGLSRPTTHVTTKPHNLRLPPDIFFTREIVE